MSKNLVLSLLLFACCLSVPSPAFTQASPGEVLFSDGQMYQVPGAVLNRLAKNLKTAKQELTTSKAENQELAKQNGEQAQRIKALSEQLAKESRDRLTDSQSKEEALTEVRRQLTTASESLERSQREALANDFLIGSVSLAVGIGAGLLIGGHR